MSPRHILIVLLLVALRPIGGAAAPAETNAPAGLDEEAQQRALRDRYWAAGDFKLGTPAAPSLKLSHTFRNRAPQEWDRSLELGLSAYRGNSDTDLYSLRLAADRATTNGSVELEARGNYGESNGEPDHENANGRLKLAHNLSLRLYTAAELRLAYDALADLDYQGIVTWSLGWQAVRRDNTLMIVEAGPGYIQEKKGPDRSGYVAGRLAERLEHKFNEFVLAWLAVEYLPSLANADTFLVNSEVGLESRLGRNLGLRVGLQNRHDSQPAEGKEEDDLFTSLSLVLNV